MTEDGGNRLHPDVPTTMCSVCGNTVPQEEFCGACGGHLVTDSPNAAGRHHSFAANPGEHVFHLAVVSTLFPHLPHRRSAPFRLALLLAAALLFALGMLRFTGPGIIASAILVPLLYLIYLYEVEVYEDEPVVVIGATFILGMLLGVPWAIVTGPIVSNTLLQNATVGSVDNTQLFLAELFPFASQFLILTGVLFLYVTRRYREALDGFTFGVTAALGFTVATTFIELLPQTRTGLVSNLATMDNVLVLLVRGLLIPFLTSSTTGLIAGALWLRRGRVRALGAHGWTTTLSTSILVSAVVWISLGLVDVRVLDIGRAAAAYAILTVAMLLWVRVALHHMLLAEAVEVRIGPEVPCANCHRIVPRMAFCPHCGIATCATPKTGTGRVGRLFR